MKINQEAKFGHFKCQGSVYLTLLLLFFLFEGKIEQNIQGTTSCEQYFK